MKVALESKFVLKNQKAILLVKSNVKAGPPLIVKRHD